MTIKVRIPVQLIIEHKAIPHLYKTEVYEWIKEKKLPWSAEVEKPVP